MIERLSPRAVVGAVLVCGLVGAAAAEDMTAEMLSYTCAGCHGPNGNSHGPAIPSIAAMDPEVVEIMNAFKENRIYSTVMGRIARGYDEEDFKKMAAYFNARDYVPAPQAFEQKLVEAGAELHEKYCDTCHVEGGKPLADEEGYHILAGQWTPYLRFAMEDYRANPPRRPMDEKEQKKMMRKIEEMVEAKGESAFEALWAYYASQQ